jgi:hypothetical protein
MKHLISWPATLPLLFEVPVSFPLEMQYLPPATSER